ncbi:MAG: hypothetical protein U0694_20935 [Anaerolineae bacterium]
MLEIARTPNYKIYWQDAERTIVVLEVFNRWTWDEAYHAVKMISDSNALVSHETYSIFWFRYDVSQLPGGLALPKLRELMTMQRPNERLVLFVMVNPLLKTMLELASRLYGLQEHMKKYRFVTSFEHATKVITRDKQTTSIS